MSEFFHHTKSSKWGVCVLVREANGQRTYLFADGATRTFKTELAAKMIEAAPEPSTEDRIRLTAGIGALGASIAPLGTRLASPTPKAIHLELEAAIANSRDAEPYLVYADWLQSQSDPRGTLIVAHHQLEQDPDNPRLKAAAAALLATHGIYFMPAGLAAALAIGTSSKARAHTTVRWHCGYIDQVRLVRRSNRTPELAPILTELLAHPSARFIRSLVLGPAQHDRYPALLDVLTESKPALAELVVGGFEVGPRMLRAVVTPTLRDLVVHDTTKTATLLDGIVTKSEGLERIGFPGGDFGDAHAKALLARVEKWRHLTLDLRDNPLGVRMRKELAEHGVTVSVDDKTLSVDTVLALAPELNVATNARELAGSSGWRELGRDGDVVWGHFIRHPDDVWTSANTKTRTIACSCAGQFRPCDHGLALLLLVANGHAIEERRRPPKFKTRNAPTLRPFRAGWD